MKFNVIYNDPPWSFSSRYVSNNKQTSLTDTYSTLSIDELSRLKISELTKKDCIMFLWITDCYFEQAIKLFNDWGFKYRTIAFVWIKKYKSGKPVLVMGPWTMKSTELCLLAIKGNPHKLMTAHNIRQLTISERQEHSKKPNEVRRRIELMFKDLPKIELFAREKHIGWTCIGNEIDGKDIKQSINEVINEV